MSPAPIDASEFALLDALLSGALDREPARRETWLREQCEQHPQRLDSVLALLRRSEQPPEWERQLQGDSLRDLMHEAVTDSTDESPPPPLWCGSWRLLGPLGVGGMAEVHLAERHCDNFAQRAAVKLLSNRTRDASLVARFEQERRILASLDDPRIARLLDGGMLPDGRPWLAMELVAGARIDSWCDARRLTVAARVRLLREVAIAVHSAHRALVVHRDIKPGNVMVTTQGDVKLLDFGIAKLLDATLSDKGLAETPTQTQSRVMTPQYASPEQLLGETVTTATDVYQLGLLLVELLVGVRPFHSRSQNLVELAHAVVNEDAPPPSQLLTRSLADAQRLSELAHLRRSTVARLRRQLRGDLDAIAQRALARDPAQRYPTALQFAEDLEHWLAQRPVRARAPSLRYRMRRFVSRNWLASAIAAALLVVLTASVFTALIQSARIQAEAGMNRQVSDFLVQLLREADPLHSRDPDPSAESVIDRGLVNARVRFAAQPLLLAELLRIGADVKVRHGDYRVSAELLQESLMLTRRADPDHPRVTDALARYGRALAYESRYREAEATLRKAEARWYAQEPAGVAWIARSLADVLHSRGEYVDAEAVLRRADRAQREHGVGALADAELARDLGVVLRDAGRLEEGRRLIETALLQFQKTVGDAHAGTGETEAALARTLALAGNTRDARRHADAAMQRQSKYYGERGAVPGMIRHTLALVEEQEGRPIAAAALLDQVLAQDYVDIAPGNVLPAYARLDRAWIRLALDDDAGARSDLEAAAPSLREIRIGGHPRLPELHLAQAVLDARTGDEDSARTAIAAAIALRRARVGDGHAATIDAVRWLRVLEGEQPVQSLVAASPLEIGRLRLLEAAVSRGD